MGRLEANIQRKFISLNYRTQIGAQYKQVVKNLKVKSNNNNNNNKQLIII